MIQNILAASVLFVLVLGGPIVCLTKYFIASNSKQDNDTNSTNYKERRAI